MDQKTELLHFYDNYYKSIKKIEKTDSFSEKFYQAFLSGENELYQKYVSETKIFDEEWIKTIESYIPSLNKIVLNPRSSIKVEEEIVAIEKAKKTSSESIKHLAANTHMIKEVNADGTVMPKRVLTTYTEVDYETYENRFIMTLIERVFIFVRSRYEIIKNNIESFEKRRFNLKSSFPINDTLVALELDFTLTDETEDKEINEFNKKLLKRVEYLNKVVTSLRSSKFMELMKEAKKVYPPIMKTNVILKNIDFRNAYLLWLFIDRYNTLAFTTEVVEKDLTFDDAYYQAVHRQVLTTYSAIIANQEMNKKAYETLKPKKYKKKSIKIKRRHKDDIELTPEDEVIEDQSLNEYYLNANKQIFKQSVDYHLETASTYEIGIKRALRDTLDISNALYESFFELDEEENIFNRLIKEVDVNKELEEARRKHLISKMIREVKQVDFNNALRQEKKFLDEIANFDKILLKEHEEKLKLGKESILNEEKVEADRKKALLEKEIVDKQLEENKYLANEVDNYRKDINAKINDYQKQLEKEYQTGIDNYRKEHRQLYNQALKEHKDKHMPKRRVTNQALKVEKDKMRKEFVKEEALAKKEHREKVSKAKQTTLEHNKTILVRDKKKYLDFVKENEENIKALEQEKKEYNKKLTELLRKLQAEEKAVLNSYEQQLKAVRDKEIKALEEQYRITDLVTKETLKEEIKKLNEKFQKEELRHKKRKEAELLQKKEKLAFNSEKEVIKIEKSLKKKKAENDDNLKALETAKKNHKKKLEELK